MKTTTQIKQTILFMTAAIALAACKVKQTELVSQLTVPAPLTLKDKDNKPITLKVGTASYAWDLLIVEQKNQKGLVLQSRDGRKTQIPFAVPTNFALGGANVPESQTQQGVGIQQIQGKTEFVDNQPPTRRTESCEIAKSERVCDRGPDGREKCFDRTITSSGQRDVVITKHGYYQPLTIQLVKQGAIVATLALTLDETSDSKDAGPCL